MKLTIPVIDPHMKRLVREGLFDNEVVISIVVYVPARERKSYFG